MYFQIENTPEHVRRARRVKNKPDETPKEECPRLVLAPFSRPPQVVFDNVLIGSSCERVLEVLNPSKQAQQITLGKALPPGLEIHLPGEWMELEPETCYDLTMIWTPTQPTAMRETIRFTNENRGRYDIIVVLKSAMNIKGKNAPPKGFKTSPGKMKKKKVPSKKSPVAIYKKKSEIIYNTTTRVQKTVNVVQSVQHKVYQTYDKENYSGIGKIDHSMNSYQCPFGSPSSITNFDTSEIFGDLKKTNNLQDTYEKSYDANNMHKKTDVPQNVLKPSNKQIYDSPTSEIFDNLTFTPLKNTASKVDKLNQGPKVIISVNSESDFDDSLVLSSNKENQMNSILTVNSQQRNTWMTINNAQIKNHLDGMMTPVIQNKKQPNTSSPKELSSPNFTINTEFSRISDLSFYPQRHSTEKKCFTKANETHDLLNDKPSSDTFTKDSPNTPVEYSHQQYQMHDRPPHYFNREQPKMCRQNLFREYQMQRDAYEKNYMNPNEQIPWHNELRTDARSPPRSMTPPLQSIPEESTQFSHTQVLDKTDNQMATFTIDRTFDKSSISTKQTWSKKSVRIEPDVWKVPVAHVKKPGKPKVVSKPRESTDNRLSNITFESNKSLNHNITANQIGNIYSQTSTVDPFLSAIYYYDEEVVHKFENEFKKWLNCILTPPADLESNEEQKVDLGKAWIESRNKEVPLAPTKEQVSSAYHDSHRLESLRRSARSLLMSTEMAQVFQKLNAQIEKKLITIRTDRNLHMDVGLQKMIMEILLSYNPLWLRIGLEAIYGIVLPLKSNSDIEGLTSFIIQRMFKNPFLKNKNSKASAPNMLLPAYMEAIKKFTLKKFFMLVYFLDQAKQRKLISHDPCLFCRNAICKESREIIIRFTRELIAGIGDITRHLKPLGYVVCHKQSYLDEYKYAVHNLALDIRDGVRLTKVMEIIMMKNGLLSQLRSPAISRLQKIHNVQVAMNALKEANFVIVGEITATDIADGHREKTLSLLWQIIHVFRAPLFERAANVIQTWWKKKYQVIAEKRKEEYRILKIKYAAVKIQQYIKSYIIMKKVREVYITQRKSAIVIQKYFRSYLLTKSLRKEYIQLRNTTITLQKRFRSLLITKEVHRSYLDLRNAALRMQRQYRAQVAMKKDKKRFIELKLATLTIQRRYRALIEMRQDRSDYLKLKSSCIKIQDVYRTYRLGKPYRQNYLKQKDAAVKIQKWFRNCKKVQQLKQQYQNCKRSCVTIQRYYRAFVLGRRVRQEYTRAKIATICLQRFFRAYLKMKTIKQEYIKTKTATLKIQKIFRSYLETTRQRKEYLKMKSAVACIETTYKRYKEYQSARTRYLHLRKVTITVQRIYRSIIAMRLQRKEFLKLKQSAVTIQHKYRALICMRLERQSYLKLKSTVTIVQSLYRAQRLMKRERLRYITTKNACISIQRHYRAYILGKKTRLAYWKQRESALSLQTRYRALLAMRRERSSYLAKKTAAITIQRRFRANKLMLVNRREYEKTVKACKIIQSRFKAFVAGKKQRTEYLRYRTSVILIQSRFKMLIKRRSYLKLRSAAVIFQTQYRAQYLMKCERRKYATIQKACISIQRFYRAYVLGKKTKEAYLKQRKAVIVLQSRYKALLALRKERNSYISMKNAVITIQRRWRAKKLMLIQREKYVRTLKACNTIQSYIRAFVAGKKQKSEFQKMKTSIILIQTRFRMVIEARKARNQYMKLRKGIVMIQQRFREKQLKQNEAVKKIQSWYRSVRSRNICRKEFLSLKQNVVTIQSVIRMHIVRTRFIQIKTATTTIQRYYRSYKLTVYKRQQYIRIKNSIVTIQSYFRRYIARKRYLRLHAAVKTIQAAYKLKKSRELERKRRDAAAIIIQKHVRQHLVQSEYRRYREKVIYIQNIWRGRLLTRLIRCDYLQKKMIVSRLQAVARGYLVRKYVQSKKEHIQKIREMHRQNWAASKIQALFRGNIARIHSDSGVAEIRRRWREGALLSKQPTLGERNKEALEILKDFSGIESVIMAFRSLELNSEVNPWAYDHNAAAVVRRVFVYMSTTNRSISSVEVLKSAAAFVVNLARYRVTGPKIYHREHIRPILKYMWRFVNSEKQLFCIFATFLWLCSKYDEIREDLTEFLHVPENHKMIVTIKGNVDRTKRMEANTKNVFYTSQSCKKSRANCSMNVSTCTINSNSSFVLPYTTPDYGITRVDGPRYFEDPQQAINCLFQTYNL